jgi:cobalt-zinc-cadmium efflux system membrane fusion protein
VPTVLALLAVAAVLALGVQTRWKLPRFSALIGQAQAETDDWCSAHSVPESICVECGKAPRPLGKEHGWCKVHGVHECPLCYPDVAQLPAPPQVTLADLDRAARALALRGRAENNSKCKLHRRLLQFASPEAMAKTGVEVEMVRRGPVTESITASGEVAFDPTRVARLSSRLPGIIRRVEKQVGDRVRRGDVLALVDAAVVGKAKAEFLQALVRADLTRQNLAGMRTALGSVPERLVQEAEAALEEAQIRLLTAQQALVNQGLPIQVEDVAGLPAAEVARRVQFLGLPEAVVRSLEPRTASSNLLAVRAPLDGVVIARQAVAGETVDALRPLFVVVDTRQMGLHLRVRLEDVKFLTLGQQVRFRRDGGGAGDTATISWLSTAVDEKTRTVQVRADLPNPDGRHLARTFGTGQVILREERDAVVVPSEAVHWEGDCNVVFVRDRQFLDRDAPKVFHVRKVRPGATADGKTEIIAGVLPGEVVATRGSGVLRGELLKNNLGAG